MKKIFTLLACVLMAGSAFGQERWKDLVVNGNMESAQDPKWSSFWCHDWRENVQFDPETGQKYDESTITENSQGMFQGFAEIVEDPVKAGNHCARVIIRTREQAEAAVNKTIDTQNNKPDWGHFTSQSGFFTSQHVSIPSYCKPYQFSNGTGTRNPHGDGSDGAYKGIASSELSPWGFWASPTE